MEQIKKLLMQISIINKKNEEMLDATGGRFNMFRVCGVNHYENTHSAIIAELLNPNGSHGLKSKLLECFVKNLGDKFTIKNFDNTNARVDREHDTGNGRIDILIEDSNQKHAIIIENKIYADDQWEQLKRYNNFAETKYGKGNYQIFYLTLWGDEASEQSGEGVDYTPLSYETDMINWLEQCVPIAVHYPMVRETINQYINHLKQLTRQDMDTKNKEEIINMIVGDKQLIENAQYVFEIWHECIGKILANLEDSVASIADKLGLEYKFSSDTGEKESYFYFRRKNWNYCILFWFEQKHELYVGVDKILDAPNNEWSDEFTSKLKDHLSNFTINNYAYNNLDWIWGTGLVAWNNLSWAQTPEEMPKIISETVESIVKKLDDFKE
ncbi:MAG: PD-(D/E)XK nuclease family protein [Dysgonamonadaceae bacterium]|jgi:hypothetical protein|nr:PD-(D/E)XK nuclease family protein [Dysgonamonadaceae bacterium]